jgi:competence protein ComGC
MGEVLDFKSILLEMLRLILVLLILLVVDIPKGRDDNEAIVKKKKGSLSVKAVIRVNSKLSLP